MPEHMLPSLCSMQALRSPLQFSYTSKCLFQYPSLFLQNFTSMAWLSCENMKGIAHSCDKRPCVLGTLVVCAVLHTFVLRVFANAVFFKKALCRWRSCTTMKRWFVDIGVFSSTVPLPSVNSRLFKADRRWLKRARILVVVFVEDKLESFVPVVIMYKDQRVGVVDVDLTGNDGMTIDQLRAVSSVFP